MFHVRLLALAVVFATLAGGRAQSPVRFQWKSGETLTYRVEQTTDVKDIDEKQTISTQTKLNLTKRWHIVSVANDGVATLQMSLLALRMETKKADGETIVFDSTRPDPQQAELNKEMLQYIGQPIATLRMDAQGRVVEVKESKFGPASRLVAELPFRLTLPDAGPSAGQTWERAYQIKLEPPQGTGETFDAVQKYTCNALANGVLTVELSTQIKNPPEASAERIPLAPMSPKGTLTFDVERGRLKKAELKMITELPEHRGEGSKYIFQSTYTEDLIEK